MKRLEIHKESDFGYTIVPNVFIDRLMVQASGEFVKVYLLLLRGSFEKEDNLSVSRLADFLQCTDNDILRALNYWQDKGILQLEYIGNELSEINLLSLNGNIRKKTQEPSFISKKEKTEVVFPKEEKNPQILYSPVKAAAPVENDEADFSQLMYVIQQYMGEPINRMEYDTFEYLHQKLGINTALLEYLVEYCVTNGHKSVRYMESVAIDWHKKKITTVEQAKEYTPIARKEVYLVMKAFGLSNRQPVEAEKNMIDKWYGEYGFSKEIVLEACNRTMSSIHTPSFDYTNKILEAWRDKGVSQLEDVIRLDEERKLTNRKLEMAKTTKTPSYVKPDIPKTRFHNFEQRDTDYDALLHQLNRRKV